MKLLKANHLRGTLTVPSDKSISHRSIMFGALAEGTTTVRNFLRGEDCLSTLHAFQELGVPIQDDGETITITGQGFGGLKAADRSIDVGNSGTTIRLMMGILAGQPFTTTLLGDDSLNQRPMNRVMLPLNQMGARLNGSNESEFPPITIQGTRDLSPIDYSMPVASAQVKSALLFAALQAQGTSRIVEKEPSRNHTEEMIRQFGGEITVKGKEIQITGPQSFVGQEVIVPGDISSAAFWLVAGSIIEDSDIILKDVGINETRTGIIDVLKAMGANIELLNVRDEVEPIADIRVRYAKLHGTSFGADIMPRLIDEIPIITVASMFAEGETIITGAGELRVKETDRLQVITDEFNKVCPCIKGTQDGLIITGSQRNNLQKVVCNSHDDHRIAMALAILGASGVGIEIENSECVNISYPTFYEILTRFE